MSDKKQLEHFYAKDIKSLREWLQENYLQKESLWLVYDKSVNGNRSLPYSEVVDELLCYGWIDSVAGTINEKQAKILISPRKPKSVWSKINKTKVEKLIESGLMTDFGLQKINNAKQDGSWDFLNSVDNLEIPEDLQKIFDKNQIASQNFLKFTDGVKKQFLYRLKMAKTYITRQKRLQEIEKMAEENRKM